jgi:hypothetical protein
MSETPVGVTRPAPFSPPPMFFIDTFPVEAVPTDLSMVVRSGRPEQAATLQRPISAGVVGVWPGVFPLPGWRLCVKSQDGVVESILGLIRRECARCLARHAALRSAHHALETMMRGLATSSAADEMDRLATEFNVLARQMRLAAKDAASRSSIGDRLVALTHSVKRVAELLQARGNDVAPYGWRDACDMRRVNRFLLALELSRGQESRFSREQGLRRALGMGNEPVDGSQLEGWLLELYACEDSFDAHAEELRTSAARERADRVALEEEAQRARGRVEEEAEAFVGCLAYEVSRVLWVVECELAKAGVEIEVDHWDPARMVGAKVRHAAERIIQWLPRRVDLDRAMRARGQAGVYASLPNAAQGPVDSDTFSDYSLLLALSRGGLDTARSRREAAIDIVKMLYSEAQVGQIVEDLPHRSRTGIDCPFDQLVSCLGWKARTNNAVRTTPLASHWRNDDELTWAGGTPDLVLVRKSFEAFCKDVVVALVFGVMVRRSAEPDVVAARENARDRVTSLLARAELLDGSFEACLRRLGGGTAARWLSAMVPMFREPRDGEVAELARRLSRIATVLNPFNHHNPDARLDATESEMLLHELFAAVDAARALLGMLPLHFLPETLVGTCPQLAFGLGWSHACDCERRWTVTLFRPITTAGETRLLLWAPRAPAASVTTAAVLPDHYSLE